MIKKINIALAVCFVAMFAMKGLKQLKQSPDRRKAPAVTEEKAVSDLPAPCVYYIYWSQYSVEDPISNRNGVFLDTIRAIFPKAEFRRLRADVSEFVQKLRDDPRAVVVGFGDHPAFKGCLAAPTPLAYTGYVVITSRNNPWRYSGPDSLKELRILARESLLDYDGIRALLDLVDSKGRKVLRTVPAETPAAAFVDMLGKGEADAFLATCSKDKGGVATGRIPEHLLHTFRMSDEIGHDPSLLYVSSLDAAYAKRVVEEYEKGLVRITESGERRRIFDYYGISDSSSASTSVKGE